MSYTKKLPIGSLGLAQVAIAVDKWGETFIHYVPYQQERFPPGTYKVHALEDIRANRDVIVVDANNGVIEHTPQELKYLNRLNQWQNLMWLYPLPVTMGTRPITWAPPLIATAAGTTPIIPAPGTNSRLLVHFVTISNRHPVAVDAAITFDIAGAIANLRLRHSIAPTGGNVPINLTDACLEGAANLMLYAWLAGAAAGGVIFNIGYTVEDVPI